MVKFMFLEVEFKKEASLALAKVVISIYAERI